MVRVAGSVLLNTTRLVWPSINLRIVGCVLESTVGAKSRLTHHGHAVLSIILFQSLLIVWLSLWAVEDYLNNEYVRAYVDGVVLADGWIFGAVTVIGVLGFITSLFVRRNRKIEDTVAVVGKSSRIHSTVRAVTTAVPKPAVQSTTQNTTASKPSVELHPAVAALKAELSEARMSLGLASVAGTTSVTPGSATRFEDQRTSIPNRAVPMLQSQQSSVRAPAQGVAQSPPSTVIQPTQYSGQVQSSSVVRPPSPAPQISLPSPQPMPAPTVHSGSATSPTVGLLPKLGQPPPGPKDISTVITGIVPAQLSKKKENDQASGNGQGSA